MLLQYFQTEKFKLKKFDLKQIQILEFMGIRKRNIDIALRHNPANIYLFKVTNRDARKRNKGCSKLAIKHQHDVVVFLLLTFNIIHNFF